MIIIQMNGQLSSRITVLRYLCSTVSSMLSGLEARSLGLNTLSTA